MNLQAYLIYPLFLRETSSFTSSIYSSYGVIGLAIAVVIGGKLNDLIGSLVNDLLMPIISRPDLQAANVDDVRKLNYDRIFYGKVIGTTADFLSLPSLFSLLRNLFPLSFTWQESSI